MHGWGKQVVALWVGLAAWSSAGCAEFDQPSELLDTRVLAVVTEPAELMLSPFYSLLAPDERPPPQVLPLPEYTVEATVYAFDPRGGQVDTEMFLCPEWEDAACRTFDVEHAVNDGPEEVRDELQAVYAPRLRTGRIGDLGRDPAGLVPDQTYQFEFTTAVIDSLIGHYRGSAGFSIFSELPRFVIDVDNPNRPPVNHERAYKRIPLSVNLADPSLPAELQSALLDLLGVKLCDEVPTDENFVEGRTDCYLPREQNHNPAFVGFNFWDPDEIDALPDDEQPPPVTFADQATLGPRSLLAVDPGAAVRVVPVFREGSVERYQILSFNIEDQTLFFENRREDFACSWSATGGQVPSLTSNQFGRSLEVEWITDETAQPGDRDALVLVTRDQRGGVAVGQITIEYR